MKQLQQLQTITKQLPIIPVLTIDDIDSGLQLCQTIADAGIHIVEITLRTPNALAFMSELKQSNIDVLVTAGTVINGKTLNRVVDLGVDICFSPGVTQDLLTAAKQTNCLIIPGVATASEVMLCLDNDIHYCKLFPASVIGGIKLLQAFAQPFGQVKFCTTGGANNDNINQLLQQRNVFAVGGSWMIDKISYQNQQFDKIAADIKALIQLLH